MSPLKYLAPLSLLLGAAACSDAIGPVADRAYDEVPQVLGAMVGPTMMAGDQPHVLRHAPDAPPLTAYDLSFWAVKGQEANVYVNYVTNYQRSGSGFVMVERFLKFHIPKRGLESYPDGSGFRNGDSVLITMRIDTSEFHVDFEPSGLQFNSRSPANLEMWYGHADPDLDGDGDVDADDEAIRQNQLSMWYHEPGPGPWHKLGSEHDPVAQWIRTTVEHFSGYAVSW